MSTKAAIGIRNPDNSISWIYQHHDGGEYGVGWSLFYRFNDEALARLLIESGGLYPAGDGGGRSRDGKPYHVTQVPGGTITSHECAFYGREEYTYLWRLGEWWLHYRWQNSRQDGGNKARWTRWRKLAPIIRDGADWLRGPVPQASYTDAANGKLFG